MIAAYLWLPLTLQRPKNAEGKSVHDRRLGNDEGDTIMPRAPWATPIWGMPQLMQSA
jgi:hypothetical protein